MCLYEKSPSHTAAPSHAENGGDPARREARLEERGGPIEAPAARHERQQRQAQEEGLLEAPLEERRRDSGDESARGHEEGHVETA